jgi:hypothetical protein
MCRDHEGHGHGPGRGRRGFRGGGFGGRHGFPSREEWVERLQAHRQRLEQDLANVRDLIARLEDGSAPPADA